MWEKLSDNDETSQDGPSEECDSKGCYLLSAIELGMKSYIMDYVWYQPKSNVHIQLMHVKDFRW